MSGHTSFLAAIANNPADDLPRLVYADFLEDTADPPRPDQAEFIRVQIELANRLVTCRHCKELNKQQSGPAGRQSCWLHIPFGTRENELFPDVVGFWNLPGTFNATSYGGYVDPIVTAREGWSYTIRRGFPDQWQGRMCYWTGECDCGIAGWERDRVAGNRWRGTRPVCGRCVPSGHTGMTAQGTGWAPGVGMAAMTARLPITKIITQDHDPHRGEAGFAWFRSSPSVRGAYRDMIPAKMWDRLLGYEPAGIGTDAKWYKDDQAARDALTAVLLRDAMKDAVFGSHEWRRDDL